MNKILYKLIGIIAAAIYSTYAYAETFEVDGIYYETEENNKNWVRVIQSPTVWSYNASSYTIPETITTGEGEQYTVVGIGDYAFWACTKLQNIVLPPSIKSIGNSAFYGCKKLTSIDFPNAIETIGGSAFSECTLLTNVVIPKSVKTIGDNPFSGCIKLNSIIVEDGNVVFNSKNNCNAIIKDNILISGCSSTIIPQGITIIGNGAFLGMDIDEIIIPNSIISIRDFAFGDCKKLQTINLPSSLEEIGEYAFAGCSELSIIDSDIANPFPIDETVFEEAYQKAKLYVPEGTTSLYQQTNGWKQFINILEGEIIPENFEVDGIYYEVDASNIFNVKVVAPQSGKYSMKSYTINKTVEYNSRTFTVSEIGAKAFYNCNDVETIVLPPTITKIGSHAFYQCGSLSSANMPEHLVEIGENAFYYCSKLTSLELPNSLTTIGSDAFYHTGLLSVIIPSSVNAIGSSAFGNCGNLSQIVVEKDNSVYNSANGCNAIFKGTVLIMGCKSSTVPSGTTEIGENAFSWCSNLESIVLPPTITKIGSNAFYQCGSLSSANMPEHLVEIGENAFYYCSKLTSLELPNSLTTIGSDAFYHTGLLSVIIPSSVNAIGSSAFGNCGNLSQIVVENGNSVYNSANGCNAIFKGTVLIMGCKSSSVPSGTTEIGENAFSWCSNLESIILPQTITKIGSYAFYQCKNLTSINIPERLTEIGDRAFYYCSKLAFLELPNTLTNIGSYAFYSCTNLIDIVSQVETPFIIDESVFGDYNGNIYSKAILSVPMGRVEAYRNTAGWSKFANIQEIEPDPTPMIDNKTYVIHKRVGYADLQSAISGEHIIIPEMIEYDGKTYIVRRILDSAFEGSNIISLSVPSSITYVGQNAIKDCNNLAAIIWGPDIKPSDNLVNSIINTNLLFYVSSENNKPDDVHRFNIIVNDTADIIFLSDGDNNDFYCPKAFSAKNVIYTHNYSLKTEKGKCQGWESIALPFDVQTYQTLNGEEIKPYLVANDGEKMFWLRELTESGLVDAKGIKANVPYIISMPNWDGYQDFYNITGEIIFSSRDTKIEATDIQPIITGTHSFYPSFQVIVKSDEMYSINQEEYNSNAPGSIFVKGLRNIRPFEAYFTTTGSAAGVKSISIAELMDGTTAIADIPETIQHVVSINGVVYIESATSGNCSVCSVSGQLMRKIALKQGMNMVEGLSKGIYIVNGKKIMVK